MTYPLQSYSLIIRDTLLATLKATPFFSSFVTRKNNMLQVQPQHLPLLALYFVKDEARPDGDWNAGHIKFVQDVTLGFSVIVQRNDPDACESKLDEAYCVIANTLWPNQYVMNLLDTRNPYQAGTGTPFNTRIEGIMAGNRRHNWGTTDNETPIGEMRFEVVCRYRDDFAPIIPDDLLEVYLTTGIKPGETQEEMDKRQQVGATYVFTPEP